MSQGKRAGFLAYLSHSAVTRVAAKDALACRHVSGGVAYRPILVCIRTIPPRIWGIFSVRPHETHRRQCGSHFCRSRVL